ncbi:MAG: BatA domain-containing protein [Ardenticatenales bacterium]|nr:BatA domain-containing protein [Ardenticatenales bacterium]
MSLRFPFALALLGAVPVIFWLHRLRRRVPERGVPSLVPWLVLRSAEPMRRRRVPPSVLLALHVLSAVLLALAAAGPLRRGDAAPSGDVALILDTTLSMRAGERWPAARAAAAEILASAAGRVTVIELGPRPAVRVARTLDPSAAAAAIEGLVPGAVGADVTGALAQAAAVAGAGARIEVVTDGALAPVVDGKVDGRVDGRVGGRPAAARSSPSTTMPAGANPVRWHVVGHDGARQNVAVVGIAAADDAAGGVRVVARIANLGPAASTARLRLSVGGRVLDETNIDLAPDTTTPAAWSVAARGGVAEVRAVRLGAAGDLAGDALPEDDVADVPLASRTWSVQFAPHGSALRRALEAQPHVRLSAVGLGTLSDDGTVDVTVLGGASAAGLSPGGLPSGGALLVDPHGGPWLVAAADAITGTWQGVALHPITAGLDLADARVSGVRAGSAPAWATVLAVVGGRPAAWAGTIDGQRVVVLGFDPDGGTLAERDAFPRLIGRAIAWAAPDMPPPSLPAGAPFALPPWPVAIAHPDGRRSLAALRFDAALVPGVYTIRRRRVPRAGVVEPGISVAVRAGDPDESGLAALTAGELAAAFAPRPSGPAGDPQAVATAGAAPLQHPASPVQRWVLAAVLCALAVEAAWRAAPARRPTARAAGGR